VRRDSCTVLDVSAGGGTLERATGHGGDGCQLRPDCDGVSPVVGENGHRQAETYRGAGHCRGVVFVRREVHTAIVGDRRKVAGVHVVAGVKPMLDGGGLSHRFTDRAGIPGGEQIAAGLPPERGTAHPSGSLLPGRVFDDGD
jgi:hypothetical protein